MGRDGLGLGYRWDLLRKELWPPLLDCAMERLWKTWDGNWQAGVSLFTYLNNIVAG